MMLTMNSMLKRTDLVTALAITLAVLVFFKNAWISEDAFIIFRSIEQLFSGNGPVWNPHERVQVYTSPLWYFVLSVTHIFFSDYYIGTIAISLLIFVLTLGLIRLLNPYNTDFSLLVLLLLLSNAFFDFTSSGLENILGYFLLTIYFLNYVGFFKNHENSYRKFHFQLILAGLIVLTRHDLTLVILPSLLYLYKQVFLSANVNLSKLIRTTIISFLPIIIFSIFAVIYYGFPFPNTAYAKLNTGIGRAELMLQGSYYFYSTLVNDPLTFVVIIFSIFWVFWQRYHRFLKYISAGVLLNLVYIFYIGGDFMQGRFFSYSFLLSTLVLFHLASHSDAPRPRIILTTILLTCLVLTPHTPLTSKLNHSDQRILMGVADERGFYFSKSSLHSYLLGQHIYNQTIYGMQFNRSPERIKVHQNIGIFGMYAGIEKIIIDPFALSDPFLARLPTKGIVRIGHFSREIPSGYIDSLKSGNNELADNCHRALYDAIRTVTQSEELFTMERFKQIFLLNTGHYQCN